MSERGDEAIVAVSIDAQGVKIDFDKALCDPKGLLQGAGAKGRSVSLRSAAESDRGTFATCSTPP